MNDRTVPLDDSEFLEFTRKRNRSLILLRIQDYLENGGLFNPECMEHEKVRDLIVDIRDYLNHEVRNESK